MAASEAGYDAAEWNRCCTSRRSRLYWDWSAAVGWPDELAGRYVYVSADAATRRPAGRPLGL